MKNHEPRRLKLMRLCNRMRDPVNRAELYAVSLMICFINGTQSRIAIVVAQVGWAPAISDTFGISVLVWAAMVFGSRLLLSSESSRPRPTDWFLAGFVAVSATMPVATLSWMGLGLLSWRLILSENDRERRAGWIFLTLTFTMFLSREFFSLFSDRILQIEAAMIGSLMGSVHEGNLVQFADGSGYMQIWPACSSFANVSLAVLCWCLFSNLAAHSVNRGYVWCLLACVAVVGINAARISLIGFFPQHYDLLHGPVGNSVANWLTLGVSLLISFIGTRFGRERTSSTYVVETVPA